MSFPIYQLPKNALMNVLRNMDVRSLILISTCSKYSKTLVKSLSLKAQKVDLFLSISGDIGFSVKFQDDFYSIILSRFTDNESQVITVRYEKPDVYFEFSNASLGKLFNHIADVFNCTTVECCFHDRPSEMEEKMVKDALANVDIKLWNRSPDYFHDFIEMYPQTKEIHAHPYENISSQCPRFQKLLVRNFDCLNLEKNFPINLNAILSINCSLLEIRSLTLTDKDINRFIRCWMKGSNPRLEYLNMNGKWFNEGVMRCQEQEIMKNISHLKMPMNKKRIFKLSTGIRFRDSRFININGGIDIIRTNGTKATILIEPKQKIFQFFVWE